ncbi:MAG: starch-binding protein [Alistipes sp.]|nr:starch-binding protein [Alistipes sp.]MBO7263805.1 starch-binding protein [Alistipes sp.]
MKLVKFFAIAVAAFAVACAPEENKTNAPEFELTESKILCDVSAGAWENCNAYAWTDNGELLGGWPGTALTEKEGDYYVWVAPAELCGQTINFIINNGTEQTVDITELVVVDGTVVALTTKGEDGKWLASINGEETEAPAPKEEPVVVLGDHSWGVTGSFNGWTDTAMTLNGNSVSATIEILAEDADKKFKVRADGAWDINYGFAATEDLTAAPVDGTSFPATFNSGDIVVAEAGTYEIVLTVDGEVETFTITKK